jgi:hypothetical protein
VAAIKTYGHLTTEDISDITGLGENKIRAVLSRYASAFAKLPSGKWEVLPDTASRKPAAAAEAR